MKSDSQHWPEAAEETDEPNRLRWVREVSAIPAYFCRFMTSFLYWRIGQRQEPVCKCGGVFVSFYLALVLAFRKTWLCLLTFVHHAPLVCQVSVMLIVKFAKKDVCCIANLMRSTWENGNCSLYLLWVYTEIRGSLESKSVLNVVPWV